MIPSASTIAVTDTMQGRRTAFTIGNVAFVMESLADLYSNREAACAREYATNAHDAHVLAGSQKPIEVTLPSALNPNFVVKDYGVGMSSEELENTYTSFGNSTKRTSNDFNGMLGFGSKSAVAYTNSFTVVSVKNGIRSVAVVTKEADGIFMRLVDENFSDEPSGTTVKIPVHNANEFTAKANDIYRFWKPGTILVNGQQPEWYVGDEIASNLYMSKSQGTSYVVMGNVGYRIANPDALFANSRMRNVSFVAYVDNGAVHFTPNREDLKYDDHTKKALHGIIKRVENEVMTAAQAEIDSQTTYWDAYSVYSEWCGRLGAGAFAKLVFDGHELQADFEFPGGWAMHHIDTNYANVYRQRYGHLAIGDMTHSLIITDYTVDRSHHSHPRKVKAWADQHNLKATTAYLTPKSEFTNVWVDPKRIVSWNDIKKIKVDSVGPTGRVAGSWDYWTEHGFVRGQTIPDNKTLLFVGYERADNVLEIIKTFGLKDVVVIKVPANRYAKFKRDNPHAKSLSSHCKPMVNFDGSSLMPEGVRAKRKINVFDRDWIKVFNNYLDEIQDPDFVRLKAILDVPESDMVEYNKHARLAMLIGRQGEFKTATEQADDSIFSKRYPLLKSWHTWNAKGHAKHIVEYINLKYKEGI